MADVNAALAAVTFTPALNANGNFSIATSVSDGVAAAVTGTKNFTGSAVNDAPTALNLTTPDAYVLNTPRNLTDIIVSDVDSSNVTANLVMDANGAGADLSVGTFGGVTATFNSGTRTWTASGAVADVNAALAAIQFTPPTGSSLDIHVTVTLNDGAGGVTVADKLLTAFPNNPPTATNLSAAESYTEDVAKNLTDILVSDVDAPTLPNVSATLTLSNLAAGTLSIGTFGSVTSTFNSGTGVWTASGVLADVNAALVAVTFNPTANFNGTFSIATSVSDGIAAAITGTKVMTGTAVNDAPVASNARKRISRGVSWPSIDATSTSTRGRNWVNPAGNFSGMSMSGARAVGDWFNAGEATP